MIFFFNDPATPEIYTLSLHDALPILGAADRHGDARRPRRGVPRRLRHADPAADRARPQAHAHPRAAAAVRAHRRRSEEHTSELQSRQYLVCRLLLEKKKNTSQRKDHI